ncbi:invasion associated locus B family protein [Candidimonas nitroreducens]|uniref:invasion associated locus B family protein n=1 Tax=Candidimonas nitroreducens TaxID=683354 RepID=UPI001303A588|nr:invasion associated locus B family protein [Candidimonas nitroreducens]
MLNNLCSMGVGRVVSVLCVAIVLAVAAPLLAATGHPASPSPKSTAAEAGASNSKHPDSWAFAKHYGDWLYRCEESTPPNGTATSECAIMQQIFATSKQEGRQLPLVTVVFSKKVGSSDHKVGAVAPVGIALRPGFALWAGDKAPLTLAFDFCRADGCVASPQPATRLESEFKAGKQAHAKFDLTNGQSVTVDISLEGFRAALTALDGGVLPPGIDQGEKAKKAHPRNK